MVMQAMTRGRSRVGAFVDMERINRTVSRWQITKSVRLRFYSDIKDKLRDGIDMVDALDILWKHGSKDGRKPDEPEALCVAEWRKRIVNGAGVGDAIRDWAPEDECRILDVGDKTGRIADVMAALLQVEAGRKRAKKAIKGAFIYPLALFALAIVALLVASFRLMPVMTEIVPVSQWTGLPVSLAVVTEGVRAYGIMVLGVSIAAIWIAMRSLPRWTGRLRVTAERFPPWNIYRSVEGIMFMLQLSRT